MNKLDFLNSMDKVLAFWPSPNKDKEPGEFKAYNTWLDVIYEKVKWIDGSRFEKVVDGLLEVRPRFRKDLDHRRLIAIYRELSDQNGWDKGKSYECQSCDGVRFVYVWLSDRKGSVIRAMRGCGTCNQKLSHIHPDFMEVPEPEPEARSIGLDRLRQIPPAFAQCLLGLADAAKLKPKDEIVEALTEASCRVDAGRRPENRQPVRSASEPIRNPIKRRNELVRDLAQADPVSVIEAGTVEEEPARTEPLPSPEVQPSPATVTPSEEGLPAF